MVHVYTGRVHTQKESTPVLRTKRRDRQIAYVYARVQEFTCCCCCCMSRITSFCSSAARRWETARRIASLFVPAPMILYSFSTARIFAWTSTIAFSTPVVQRERGREKDGRRWGAVGRVMFHMLHLRKIGPEISPRTHAPNWRPRREEEQKAENLSANELLNDGKSTSSKQRIFCETVFLFIL